MVLPLAFGPLPQIACGPPVEAYHVQMPEGDRHEHESEEPQATVEEPEEAAADRE
jgi:hypothetical protein